MSGVDVVIIGGAAMGSAAAYHLARLAPGSAVIVFERDLTYRRSSTMLSDGNVRIQFNLEENVRISQYAFEVLDTFADDMEVGGHRPEVHARRQGNLFLTDVEHEPIARAGLELQRRLGCDVSWLDAGDVGRKWSLYRGPGYVGGTFSPGDGSIDPGAVVRGYRQMAVSLGVEFVEAEVSGIVRDEDSVTGVHLADGSLVEAPVVVNCAGAWGPDLLGAIGVELPVTPVMRNVFIVASPLEWHGSIPSVFLPSGLYVLPEHDGRFLVAWSQPDDPVGFDFTLHRTTFYDRIWPELVRQLPAFDQLEVVGGWPGLYAVNTLDGNAIVGEWPRVTGLYVCTGFSGHGFQQCHAMGRYLAEIIVGRDPALDLSRLGPQRVIDGEPLYEHAGRLI